MPNLPKIRWKAISLSKYGNRIEENEDACFPIGEGSLPAAEREFVAVIADGATQTSFSGLWARLLIQHAYAQGYPSGDLGTITRDAQGCWSQEIAKLQLPWHAEEKVKSGSFSTLIWFGLKLSGRPTGGGRTSGGKWRATGAGDSVVIQMRKGGILNAFPLTKSEEFARDPVLLSSIPARNAAILQRPEDHLVDGAWATGDEFLLMTDALAGWFLRESEKGGSPILDLRTHFVNRPDSKDSFARWIGGLRLSRSIKNDDTTLIWIGVGGKLPGVTLLP